MQFQEYSNYLDDSVQQASTEKSLSTLKFILLILSALNLVTFASCLIMVLFKTRMGFYYRMGFIYGAYLVSFTLRLLLDLNRFFPGENIEQKMYPWLKVFNTIAIRTKCIFVVYFVIIAREMKLKLLTDNPGEFNKKMKSQKLFNKVMLIIYLMT